MASAQEDSRAAEDAHPDKGCLTHDRLRRLAARMSFDGTAAYAAARFAVANLAAPQVLLHFAQTIATERPRVSAASAGSE
jgi:hypothetical protein